MRLMTNYMQILALQIGVNIYLGKWNTMVCDLVKKSC